MTTRKTSAIAAVALCAALALTGCTAATSTPTPTPTATQTDGKVNGAKTLPGVITDSIKKSVSTGLYIVGSDGLGGKVEGAFDPARAAGLNVVFHTTNPENLIYAPADAFGDGSNGVMLLADLRSAVETEKTAQILFSKESNEYTFIPEGGMSEFVITVKDGVITKVDALLMRDDNTAVAINYVLTYDVTSDAKALFSQIG